MYCSNAIATHQKTNKKIDKSIKKNLCHTMLDLLNGKCIRTITSIHDVVLYLKVNVSVLDLLPGNKILCLYVLIREHL